ncbi:hypothetical protein DFH28DRAFT_933897 [Melampsora americana]|nr:hypothetical protein DFH28DRAFT_933897 [Melampsora americana]
MPPHSVMPRLAGEVYDLQQPFDAYLPEAQIPRSTTLNPVEQMISQIAPVEVEPERNHCLKLIYPKYTQSLDGKFIFSFENRTLYEVEMNDKLSYRSYETLNLEAYCVKSCFGSAIPAQEAEDYPHVWIIERQKRGVPHALAHPVVVVMEDDLKLKEFERKFNKTLY